MPQQDNLDQDDQDEVERANRLRDQIARIKARRPKRASDHDQSLREPIADRAAQFRSPHQPHKPLKASPPGKRS